MRMDDFRGARGDDNEQCADHGVVVGVDEISSRRVRADLFW